MPALLLACLLLVTSCGSSDTDDAAAADRTTISAPATSTTEGPSVADDAFPVTIEHKYGSTTVTEEPERIVVVGLTEQDALLALGAVPVATTEWFGDHPGSVFPWAQDELDALGGAVPESLGDSTAYNFEAVAAQEPDLILALYSGLTRSDYETMAEIAPTIAQPADYVDYGIPWDELTVKVGQALGRADQAEALVAGVEDEFAQARQDHPELVGASAVAATPYEGIYVYGPDDARGRLLTSLGFELPADLEEVTGDEFGASISPEEADYLDLDVVVWLDYAGAEGAVGTEVYEALPVHTEGREVHLDSFGDPLGAATSFVTVLSLPFLLDGLVPRLALAIDGDPATVVPGP